MGIIYFLWAYDQFDDIREGLWIFGKCWRRGYGISTEKKGGVTRNQ